MAEPSEVPLLKAIVTSLGGVPIGQTEVPLLKQIVELLDDGAGGGGGSGTVTSVGLALPSIFSVSGSPVTTSGTLTGDLATQAANTLFAGPTTGADATPTFRALVNADIPAPGNTGEILFSDASRMAADNRLTFNAGALSIGQDGTATGQVIIYGSGAAGGSILLHNNGGFHAEILNSNLTGDQTFQYPDATGTLVLEDNTATLTNKTISGADNTLTNIATTSLTGTLQAAQFPALTGDVTTTAGSLATAIANNAVTNAKAADMAQATIKGRASGAGTGDQTDLTADQVMAVLATSSTPPILASTTKVRQVVIVTPKTDTASGTDVAPTWGTAYSGSITTTAADSKVIVICCAQVSSTSGYGCFARLERSGSPLVQGDAASNRTRTQLFVSLTSGGGRMIFPGTLVASDTPGSAAVHTYDLAMSVESGGTWYLNRSSDDSDADYIGRGATTMFLIEVAP